MTVNLWGRASKSYETGAGLKVFEESGYKHEGLSTLLFHSIVFSASWRWTLKKCSRECMAMHLEVPKKVQGSIVLCPVPTHSKKKLLSQIAFSLNTQERQRGRMRIMLP